MSSGIEYGFLLQNFIRKIYHKRTIVKNIVVLNQKIFQLVKITFKLITEICLRTKFISTIQTTTADFIVLSIDNRLMKYWTRNKFLIKIRTKIETVCFSHANIVKTGSIDICGRKIIKKQFTSHRYVYSLSQNNYLLLRMGSIG